MSYYNTLGISNQATLDDIKHAYRKLASQYHPDKGGDTSKFQEIQKAYETLSDSIKRGQYNESMNDPNNFSNLADFLSKFEHTTTKKEKIYAVSFNIKLEQIANGSNESIAVQTPEGPKLIHIRVPKGLENGHTYRYDNVMGDGHLNVTFNIIKHDRYERVGLDLYTSEKIDVFDLMLGTTISVQTIYDKLLDIEIPAMTKIGAKFRLPQQGLQTETKTGDHYVMLYPVIPENISERLLGEITKEKVYNLYRKVKN